MMYRDDVDYIDRCSVEIYRIISKNSFEKKSERERENRGWTIFDE